MYTYVCVRVRQNCTDPALAQFERQLGHAVAAYEPHVLVAYSGYFTAQDAGLLNAASFITPDAQYSVITCVKGAERSLTW